MYWQRILPIMPAVNGKGSEWHMHEDVSISLDSFHFRANLHVLIWLPVHITHRVTQHLCGTEFHFQDWNSSVVPQHN